MGKKINCYLSAVCGQEPRFIELQSWDEKQCIIWRWFGFVRLSVHLLLTRDWQFCGRDKKTLFLRRDQPGSNYSTESGYSNNTSYPFHSLSLKWPDIALKTAQTHLVRRMTTSNKSFVDLKQLKRTCQRNKMLIIILSSTACMGCGGGECPIGEDSVTATGRKVDASNCFLNFRISYQKIPPFRHAL